MNTLMNKKIGYKLIDNKYINTSDVNKFITI